MSVDPANVKPGMEVVDWRGDLIGGVKAVRETDFHVDRPMARDVYVPFEAIQAVVSDDSTDVDTTRVILTVRADDVDNQGWPHP